MDIGEVVRESGLAFWEGDEGNPWSVVQEVNVLLWNTPGTTPYDRLEFLLRAVTLDRFILSANMVRGWSQVRDFFEIAKGCYEDRVLMWTWDRCDPPWRDPAVVEEYMSQCLDVARRSGVWYPAGWLKVLSEIRAAVRRDALERERASRSHHARS